MAAPQVAQMERQSDRVRLPGAQGGDRDNRAPLVCITATMCGIRLDKH